MSCLIQLRPFPPLSDDREFADSEYVKKELTGMFQCQFDIVLFVLVVSVCVGDVCAKHKL